MYEVWPAGYGSAACFAIRDIKRNPDKHGMGRAIFGVVMGGLFTAALLIVLVVAVVQAG